MVGCAVKLGDGPFEPLILLAIVGPVPKNIPALMPAAGAEAFGGELLARKMIDANDGTSNGIQKPNGWPDHSDYSGRWCHSDMKDVAYFYNFKFYDKAVEKGNLK